MRPGGGHTLTHLLMPKAQSSLCPTPQKTGLPEGELCPLLLFPTPAPSVALPLIKQQQWPRQPHRVLELLLIGVLSSLRPTGPVVTHGKGTGQGGEA